MLGFFSKLWAQFSNSPPKIYPPNFIAIAASPAETPVRYSIIWQGKSHWLYLSHKPSWPVNISGAVNYTPIPGVEGFCWVQQAALQCEFEQRQEALRFINEYIPTLKRNARIVPVQPRAKALEKEINHAEAAHEKDAENWKSPEDWEHLGKPHRIDGCPNCGRTGCSGCLRDF